MDKSTLPLNGGICQLLIGAGLCSFTVGDDVPFWRQCFTFYPAEQFVTTVLACLVCSAFWFFRLTVGWRYPFGGCGRTSFVKLGLVLASKWTGSDVDLVCC